MSALKDLSSHAHPGTYAEYSQGINPQHVSAFLSGLTQIYIALLTPGVLLIKDLDLYSSSDPRDLLIKDLTVTPPKWSLSTLKTKTDSLPWPLKS